MASQAQRQWEQVCSFLEKAAKQHPSPQLGCSPCRTLSQSVVFDSLGMSQELVDLLAAIQGQPAAPRAVWKKLLQQEVGMVLHT